jgi:hypothetical protein
VNHTTQVIIAVLVAAALVTGMFAPGIQAAQAGGRHKYKGSGDSVAFEQENKQKAKCLALVISRADACNQEARNNFNVGVGEGPSPPPIAEECTRVLPTTVFDVTLTEASDGFPVGTVICLLKPGQNSPTASPPGAAIIPPTGTPLTGQTVRIDNSVGGDCPQGVTALVDSGNPPGTFDIGDTACITIST